MFEIQNYIEFNSNNRAVCPACVEEKGEGHRNLNLSLLPNGAYKCFRGCRPEEIRGALGAPKEERLPPTSRINAIKPIVKATLSPQKIRESSEQLLANANPARKWLNDRGISDGLIRHHRLGLCRAKINGKYFNAIAIPIPANADGTQFYQKKRVAPWLPKEEQPKEFKPWSQYGVPNTTWFSYLPPEAAQTYLCEGEWDAIRLGALLAESGADVACASFTGGCDNVPLPEQLDLLPGKIAIFYDRNDEPDKQGIRPGERGARKVAQALGARGHIANVPMPDDCTVKGWDVSSAIAYGYGLEDFELAAARARTPQAGEENPVRSRLRTNGQLWDSAPDHVEWLVPDIFTQDELFILGMPPRGGKSLFALTLAKSVAMGSNFLDRPTNQGTVLYINLEDSELKIKQRELSQGWERDLPVLWLEDWKFSELDYLRKICEEIEDLRLVIVDTLSRARDDQHTESSAELGRVVEPLQRWAKERGICVLLIHHTGKVGQGQSLTDPFELLRGSSALRATCRGALVLIPGESSYRLIAENGFSDRLDVNVRINPNTLEWQLLGNWQPRVDGNMKSQILDQLALVGEATVSEIAQALNFGAASVSTIMSRLHRDDLVSKRLGKGRSPALYQRSSNLLKQFEQVFEHPKAYGVANTDVAQTVNKSKKNSLNVCNSSKSVQTDASLSKGIDESVKPLSEKGSEHYVHVMNKSPETLSQQEFQDSAHFSTSPLIQSKCLSKPANPDSASDVCSNSTIDLFEQICTNKGDPRSQKTGSQSQTIQVGCQVNYVGEVGTLFRLFGMKRLDVLAIEGENAVVKHQKALVSQTVPLCDLQVVRFRARR